MNLGLKCTVNGARDLRMCGEAKPFIGQPCLFVKICKSGLYQVVLEKDQKQVLTVPGFNVTFDPPQTRESLVKLSLDRLRATEVRSPSHLS